MQGDSGAGLRKLTGKDIFLSNLESKGGRFRFSRYNGLPLRYAGGKSLGVGYVIEQIPNGVSSLVLLHFSVAGR